MKAESRQIPQKLATRLKFAYWVDKSVWCFKNNTWSWRKHRTISSTILFIV